MTPLLLTLALLHGGDLGTTQALLARRGLELNLILPQPRAENAAVQAGVTTAEIVLLQRLARTHPRRARILAVVAIGFEAAIVGHNARELHHAGAF